MHLRFIAVLIVLLLAAVACAEEGGGGEGAAECPPDDEFGCVTVAEGEPIRLATLLVISTADAPLGQDSQNGVTLAVNDHGEVLGHEVELMHEDEQCSAEGGTTGARRIAAEEGIVAVIGTSCSSAGEPASQILSEQGIVLMSPSNTAPSLTDPETRQDFYFRTAHNDNIQGAAMAQFAAEELGVERAATIHDGSPYAEQLQQVFAETFQSEYGGEITTQEAVGPEDTDFRPVLTSIAAGDPEFIYYPIFIAAGGHITAQARETSGLEEADLAGADGMFSPDFIEAAGPQNAEGMYLSGPDLDFRGDFYRDEFLPAYEEEFGSQPTAAFHAHAYDATQMILTAIEEAALQGDDGSLVIPRTALRDALEGMQHDGIVGQLECDENGDCNQEATISVSQVQDGDFSRVWP
ncbi:MAG TPA: branched-chain amino acid ABC transporter substrate-binding protein [Egibacteraceae bacterium]|nr:branched-chain amino acid ABC transporter substrate-binding protein [Egibacteraceae bacterium]